jgi:AhpD family alkylhydroperoxidase
MTRIPPTSPDVYVPVFGEDASHAERVFAHSPDIAQAYLAFGAAARAHGVLPFRLVELVRIRVAFHNQCRLCMSLRYEDADGQSVDESLVCSLAQPEEASDLSPAEVVALDFADRMASDHLSVDDALFVRLHEHFDDSELMELCLRVAANVGFGRMAAVLDVVPHDELPPTLRGDGQLAPWAAEPLVQS